MSKPNKASGSVRRSVSAGRKSKNTFVTKSGQTIKINRSLGDQLKAARENRAKRRAERMTGMPKSRFKRFFFRLQPKRLYKYWFSREGAIMALKIIGLGIIAGFVLIFGVFAYIRKDLPNLNDVNASKLGGSIRYYDKTGQTLLWEDYDAVKRIPVQDQDISPYLKNATVAVEDKDFFKHGGFDVRGIVRAGINDTLGSGGTQGGSTITQQLVKLSQNWTDNRTVTRKAKELVLSVELERTYSKQQILTGYLNAAPYGGIEYGVEAASQDYFQKSAKDLTIDEAALLASMPKSPTYYTPYQSNFKGSQNQKDLIGRQHYVIGLMAQQHMISQAQAEAAQKVDTLAKIKPLTSKYNNIQAPWFVLAAKKHLEQQFTTATYNRGGWKVITTLDLNLQHVAEEQLQKGLAQVRRQGGDTAAFVGEDVKTGQVVALVGGADFNDPGHGQNNYATDYRLPPGSSIKAYDYAALIDNSSNAGAGSVLYDSKGPIPPGYPCAHPNLVPPANGADCVYDFSRTFNGPVTLRYAVGVSLNVPAVKAMSIAGVDKTIQVADGLMSNPAGYQCYADDSLTIPNQCGQASAIGDGAYTTLADHVNGYASLARNGLAVPQAYILSITDSSNKNLYQWQQPKGQQVIRPDAAYIVGNMISDPNASYFPASNKPQVYKNAQGIWHFSVKTGTTNDSKDGWMMGFSSQYAAGVWVGYHNRQVNMAEPMEAMTQPIWQGWMRAVHADSKPVDITRPSDIQVLPAYVISSHSGTLYGAVLPSPATDLFPSWYKAPGKATGSRQVIDVVSGKLATDCTPERARKTITNGDSNSFSIDTFVKGAAASAISGQDDVHICGEAQPTISIDSSPQTCSGSCTITVTVNQGAHPLSGDQFKGTVNILIGGQIVQSYEVSNPGSGIPLTFTYNGMGTQQVTAQIIDSVLYDATSGPATIDFGSGGGGDSTPSPLTLSQPSINGHTAKFTWVGGGGQYTLTVKETSPVGFTYPPCNTSSTSCTVDISPGTSSYTATLTDSNNDTPSTISFNK